jgi:uridine kinase
MNRPSLLADTAGRIRAKSSRDRPTVSVIAVDGLGGAGKTSFAKRLAEKLGDAPIIQTDDFASWDNPLNWWPDLLEKALRPLAAGRPAKFTPTNWGGPPKDQVVIQPVEFVILEGVSASREAFRPFLAYSIWIDAPRDVRLSRGLARDSEMRASQGLEPNRGEVRANWKRWMAEEDDYVAREKPQEYADQIVPGDQELWD